jgi:hypothetical protein
VAAYQVSGEYAMIEAAAARWRIVGPGDPRSVTSIRRGAAIVLTYWATGWRRADRPPSAAAADSRRWARRSMITHVLSHWGGDRGDATPRPGVTPIRTARPPRRRCSGGPSK